jgi:WD40 repeat protein
MSDKRIFISYSTKDGAVVAATLRTELEAANHSVWQDIIALEGGRDWWSQIENALKSKALQHFVLIVTPGSLASPVVRREIRLARQEGKTVSPVRGPGLANLADAPRWLGQVYDLDRVEHRRTLMRVLEGLSVQKRVPMMAPEPPVDFVQRPVEFEALKRKLLDAKGDSVAITAALRGAGGYGKTTLAKALAHDPDIADAYFDGILWAELGEKPENLISVVADLVEILNGERPGLENLSSAAAKLGEALSDRRILLVIDDAWRGVDLRSFLQGGRYTTRLITTRRDDILPAEARRQTVDAMAVKEALSLLSWSLPEDQTAAQTQALSDLAQRLCEWALLLKLVNGFLQDRVIKNHEALSQAIVGVNRRLDVKGLTAFDAKNEAERARAVAKTIGVSLELLDDGERARFAELAVFPEDVDVPLGIVSRLWSETGQLDDVDTEDLLQRLQNLSLLLSLDLDRRTLRFHDTVRHFVQNQAGKNGLAALHKRLLEALEGIDTSADETSRRYFFVHRPVHLSDAGERTALDALLLDPSWLQAKLNALGSPQALVADYDQFAQGEVQDLIGRTLRLTSGICARDKRQLLPQLHGRLMGQGGAADFCANARKLVVPPAILTFGPSLTPPGAELARLEGHTDEVWALAVLRDGRLASGSSDGIVRLWDLKSGAEAARLEGHADWVKTLVVLQDGRLASGSSDNTIRLWDVKTGVETARLDGHDGGVNALAALPDGRLASGSDDGIIRLWNGKTGRETTRLHGHEDCVRALAVLPNGRLASGSNDCTVRLWDLKKDAEMARLEGHDDWVRALAVLPDGRLASGSDDGTIRLWDRKYRAEEMLLRNVRGVNALTALPDGRLASSSLIIRIWDLKSGVETAWLDGHDSSVSALAVLPDGRIASGSADTTIRLWHVSSGSKIKLLERHDSSVFALATLPDGRLASGSDDMTIRIWDPRSCTVVMRLDDHDESVDALTVLPDGRLVSGASDKTIRLWDAKTGRELVRFEGHEGSVTALAVLADGRLASGSYDGIIRLWNGKTGRETTRLHGHEDCVRALAVLPNGRFASGSDDRTIRLWDAGTGQETARLEGHGGPVWALAVLPDGRLASGSSDTTIRLWDATTGQEKARLRGHGGPAGALAMMPDGRLASGSTDNTIRLWDAKTGQETARLEVDFAVFCLAALGGKRLAAGDAGGRIHWLEILV